MKPSPPPTKFILENAGTAPTPAENVAGFQETSPEPFGLSRGNSVNLRSGTASSPALPDRCNTATTNTRFQRDRSKSTTHFKATDVVQAGTEEESSIQGTPRSRHSVGSNTLYDTPQLFSIDSIFELGSSVTVYERSLLRYCKSCLLLSSLSSSRYPLATLYWF